MPESQESWNLPEDYHRIMVESVITKFGFDRALSYEVDDEGKIHARYGRGIKPQNSSYYDGRLPDPGEVMDMAILEKKEQLVLDPLRDPRCKRSKVKRDNTKEFAVIPLEKEGRVVSLLTVNNWDSNRRLEGKWQIFRQIKQMFSLNPELDAPSLKPPD